MNDRDRKILRQPPIADGEYQVWVTINGVHHLYGVYSDISKAATACLNQEDTGVTVSVTRIVRFTATFSEESP